MKASERKMEFLVDAQARASAQIEKLAEGHAILTRVMQGSASGQRPVKIAWKLRSRSSNAWLKTLIA